MSQSVSPQSTTATPSRAFFGGLLAFFSPSVFPDDDDKTLRAALLNGVFLVAIVVTLVILLGIWLGGRTPAPAVQVVIVFLSVTLGLYFLLRRRHVQLASYVLLLNLFLVVTTTTALLGTVRVPVISTLIPVIVVAGLLVDLRSMILATLLSSFAVAVLIYAENAGWLPPPALGVTVTQWVTFTANFAFVAVLVYLSVRGTQRALARARAELAQRRQAEAALVSLTTELGERVAERTRELSAANEQLQTELRTRQQTEQALRDNLVRVEALYRITQSAVLETSLHDQLQVIADTLVRALPANGVSLIALDNAHRQVEHFILSGTGSEQMMRVAWSELQEGLTGWVLRERKVASSPKGMLDERESPAVQKRRAETNCGAIMVVPLLHQNEILGTLTAINRLDQKDFDASDAELMQIIANQAAVTVQRKRDQETLRYQNEFLSALNRITLDLLNHRKPEELLKGIVDAASKLLDAPFVIVMLEEDGDLVPRAFTRNQAFLQGRRASRDSAHLSWQAFDSRQPAVVEDYSVWEGRLPIYEQLGMHAVADLPIFIGDKALGVLGVARDRPGYIFAPEELRLGELFAKLVAVVLDNSQLRESLQEQATRDPLTGLNNRRYMREWLEQELARGERQTFTLGLVLLDLDHFKALNDAFGHHAGDRALCAVAEFLRTHLRAGDLVCRYGGEEFLFVLPGASLQDTCQRAEKFRTHIPTLLITDHETQLPPLSASFGVACFPQHGRDSDSLIRTADAMLYRAKQNGRNRVEVASE